MSTVHLVNHKTRMCQILQGPDSGKDHLANIAQAKKDGFVEVTPAEQDEFRAKTRVALNAGWNPDGRTSYAKFMDKHFPSD